MRILFLGDIVGRAARHGVLAVLPSLIKELAADFTIINGENAAGGFGITPAIADEFFAAGTDVVTTGNHVWDRREIIPYIDDQPRLIRPLNMVDVKAGKGSVVVTKNQKRLMVINCMTNLFMPDSDNMFEVLAGCLAKYALAQQAPTKSKGKTKSQPHAIVIDVHGEATSEKTATGLFVDGRVSLVVGTHTHVPTSDHRILPKGTAFISDVGMCGDYASVIGMDAEVAIGRFTHVLDNSNGNSNSNGRLRVGMGTPSICGVVVDTDDATGLAQGIYPLRRGGCLSEVTPPPPSPTHT
ncbi:MAG: YmdB family metallophosphoesterase [Proteobacteria bacterium]|nr:YmdB family metallophosphoesterase [Pseudomonadota bacterium]